MNMDLTGLMAVTLLFGGGTLFLLALSPVGRALASRIQGRVPGSEDLEHRVQELEHALVDEVDGLRQELTEVQERLDFTERLLARRKEAGRLSAGTDESD